MKKGIVTLTKAKIKNAKEEIKWNNKILKYAKNWDIDENNDFSEKKKDEIKKANIELKAKIERLEKYLV